MRKTSLGILGLVRLGAMIMRHRQRQNTVTNFLTENETRDILKLLVDHDLARAADVVTGRHQST